MKKFVLLLLLLCISLPGSVVGQRLTESIHLNQIGFYPGSPKQAVVTEGEPDVFYILTPDFMDTLYTGNLSPIMEAPNAGQRVRIADFSDFDEPGTYILWLTKLGYSYQFTISPNVYEAAAKASLKSYYHQRLSIPISYEYGGIWARPEGHPDTIVYVHPSAATEHRPAGTIISAPKGWYDAGDYNKYAVNSGITMGTMFSLYEDFPEYVRSFDVDIPETGNGIPDLLDELLWNLRWFLNMQDPYDGGVYHKLTNANFDGRIMPAEARNKRYVIQKSVTGTLNFAAVMAQASRIFADYEELLPGLADSCLSAAKYAWEWAQANPDKLYNQHAMNQQYDPDILTGAYGDGDASDEFFWAATELFATTGDASYLEGVEAFPEGLRTATIPTWNSVQTLGYYTLARFRDELPRSASREVEHAQAMIIGLADSLLAAQKESGYRTVMDGVGLYNWGSSSNAANQGIALINAYL
ncbi:glycoside hydrolase family 9 protein, partial [Balneolaceae bacterium ANBcel3]|nr:glycoside hydrolase family 9 protein [Balneolaceae bacterium ANBcel3]